MAKTAKGLVDHAQRALREKWWYVWGTFGNLLTQQLLDTKATQYPQYNGGSNYAVHKRHLGETACDCVGLIKGYCMWDDLRDKPVYKASLDVNTNMIFAAAREKGPINTIPEIKGVCVYMPGHVGVYVGGGWVIECAGGRGAVRTPIKNGTPWTHWFKCPYIYYDTVSASYPPTPFSEGDKVVITGDRYATGQLIPAWVKTRTYTVLKPETGRVLLKEIMSWVKNCDVKLA